MDDFGLLVAIHNTALPSLSDGEYRTLQLDSSGRLIIAGQFLEDAAHSSGDPGLHVLAVRNDTEGSLVSTDGDYAPLQVDSSGRLRVIADIDVGSSAEYAEDSAHTTGDSGNFVLAVRQDTKASTGGTDGDYVALIQDADGDLYVTDTVAQASLSSIDTSIGNIETDTGNIDTSLNNIEADIAALEKIEDSAHSSGDSGVMSLAVRQDSKSSLVDTDGDYAPLKVDADGDLYVSDTVAQASLSNIDTSLNNIETDIAALEKAEDAAHSSGDSGIMALVVRSDTKASTAGTDGDYAALIQDADGDLYVSDTVAQGSLSAIAADIAALEKAEDAAHSSGDSGLMALAVRADSDGSLVSTDGDYAPFQVNAEGKLKVAAEPAPDGAEAYNNSDGLAAAADGIIEVTTSFTDVVSVSVGAGQTAYVYGYGWTADKNAEMRIVSDDTSDVIVYKNGLNSSSQPGAEAHWSEGGRIEIPGAASKVVKMQVRSRTAATANASGSLHVRVI